MKWAYLFLILLMVLLSSILIREYYFFEYEMQRLIYLQKKYERYISLLKKNEKEKRLESMKNSSIDLKVNQHKEKNVEIKFDLCCINKTQSKKQVDRKRNLVLKNNKEKTLLDKLTKKLRREPIFIWPVNRTSFWLSSVFGPRKNPDGKWGFHTGIDLAAIKGTPIYAAGSGKILEAMYLNGYGNTILIEHDSKFRTRYAHLDEILVRKNQKVKKSDLIGRVGSTGIVRKSKKNGDASHLHFEIYVYGKHVNPFYFLE